MVSPRGRAASPSGSKRPADNEPPISPPPLKRKAQSTITKSVVANFFTPASQKPKERTIWAERSPHEDTLPTLLVAKYIPENDKPNERKYLAEKRKIAAFDLDSTLITSASGKRHADDAADWKWWHHSVPGRLKQLYNDEGYQIVVFTNQGGLTLHPDPKSKAPKNLKNRVPAFKQKCNVVLSQLDIPITLYAATGKDRFRKPRTGMWTEMRDDYDLIIADIDFENSIFVGDAAGRIATLQGGVAIPKDFSCSDRNLADNIGIPFQTPEEFFLEEKPREFTREFNLARFPFHEDERTGDVEFKKTNPKDIVLFVGMPGAGKSTFYRKYLQPLGYGRVNQDTLKSKDKCFKAAAEFLKEGDSVVIDNTNPDPDIRAEWIELAKKHKVPIRCVWFKTPLHIAEHNDVVRSMNKTMNPEERQSLPKLAFNSFAARFKEPKTKEGFHDIRQVEFEFRGTREEYDIWGKYWV